MLYCNYYSGLIGNNNLITSVLSLRCKLQKKLNLHQKSFISTNLRKMFWTITPIGSL